MWGFFSSIEINSDFTSLELVIVYIFIYTAIQSRSLSYATGYTSRVLAALYSPWQVFKKEIFQTFLKFNTDRRIVFNNL